MARNIVLGNWKMNLNLLQAQQLLNELAQKHTEVPNNVILGVSTPSTYIQQASTVLQTTLTWWGSQNIYHKASGAFTGEISAEMVKSLDAHFTLIGHSERREYFNESNEQLKCKVDLALEQKLTVVFCCGETLDQRKKGTYLDVLKTQLTESLLHLEDDKYENVIIAYEPVWAIGTGETASADQAQEVHSFIRGLLKETKSEEVARNTSILYGGSCKPNNSKELFGMPDINGGLIGGASLNVNDFIAIANSF